MRIYRWTLCAPHNTLHTLTIISTMSGLAYGNCIGSGWVKLALRIEMICYPDRIHCLLQSIHLVLVRIES